MVMSKKNVRSYYAGDTFLWQDLSGDLAIRYANAIQQIISTLPYKGKRDGSGVCADIGCGGGRYTQLLTHYFQGVCGLDYTFHFLKAGRELFGGHIDFVCGDAVNLPLCNNSMDFILSVGLTECLSSTQMSAFFVEVSRVLKPGGYALVRVWKRVGFSYLLSRVGKGISTAYPEFYFHSERHIKRFCAHASFRQTTFFGALLIARWYFERRIAWPHKIKEKLLVVESNYRKYSSLYDTFFFVHKSEQLYAITSFTPYSSVLPLFKTN